MADAPLAPRQTLLTGPVLGGLVLVMLSGTTTLYLTHDRGSKEWRGGPSNATLRHGFWPPPSADFDWCEPNYVHSPLVMETWNTVTSLCFCLSPAYLWRSAAGDWEVRLNLLLLAGIGVGLVGEGADAVGPVRVTARGTAKV